MSNAAFTDDEYGKWHELCVQQGRPQVSRRVVAEVHARMVKANS